MSGCDEFRDALSARLDGALSPAEARALEAHLAQCPACRSSLATLRDTVEAVKSLEAVEPPPGFAEAVLARIPAPRRRPGLLAAHPQLSAAALVFLAFTGLVVARVIGPRRGVPAPQPPLPPAAPAGPLPPPPEPFPAPLDSRAPARPAPRPDAPPAAEASPSRKDAPPPSTVPPPAPQAMPSPLAVPRSQEAPAPMVAAPAARMDKAAESLRQEVKEEAYLRASKGAPEGAVLALRLDPKVPDPGPAIQAALERCGATAIRLEGRTATARLEGHRLPSLLSALEPTATPRTAPPPDPPPVVRLILSW